LGVGVLTPAFTPVLPTDSLTHFKESLVVSLFLRLNPSVLEERKDRAFETKMKQSALKQLKVNKG